MTGPTRATPALLWSRAAVLSVVVLAVSVIGHVSAGGLLPGPWALTLLLLATAAVSARFLTRQASPVRVVALLVAGQAAVHAVLSGLAGHDSTASGSPRAEGATGTFVFEGLQAERTGSYFDQVAAMQHEAPPVPAVGHEAGWSHLVDHVLTQSPLMLLAHLGVVVVLGIWLAVGERALWTVVTLTTGRLLARVSARAVLLPARCRILLERVRRPAVLVATGRDAVPLPHLLHHVVAHRGPPALLSA